eukprot:359480-Chlamydomonas_euryale.AAC.2
MTRGNGAGGRGQADEGRRTRGATWGRPLQPPACVATVPMSGKLIDATRGAIANSVPAPAPPTHPVCTAHLSALSPRLHGAPPHSPKVRMARICLGMCATADIRPHLPFTPPHTLQPKPLSHITPVPGCGMRPRSQGA